MDLNVGGMAMTVDERSRLQLAEALKQVLGDEEGITLMELLPPVGWADVATRHDLVALKSDLVALESRVDARFERLEAHMDARFEITEARMEAKFERGFRQTIVTTASLMVSGFIATIIAVIAR
jgi:hypothetical protein